VLQVAVSALAFGAVTRCAAPSRARCGRPPRRCWRPGSTAPCAAAHIVISPIPAPRLILTAAAGQCGKPALPAPDA
jgi:hypothetical protein